MTGELRRLPRRVRHSRAFAGVLISFASDIGVEGADLYAPSQLPMLSVSAAPIIAQEAFVQVPCTLDLAKNRQQYFGLGSLFNWMRP